MHNYQAASNQPISVPGKNKTPRRVGALCAIAPGFFDISRGQDPSKWIKFAPTGSASCSWSVSPFTQLPSFTKWLPTQILAENHHPNYPPVMTNIAIEFMAISMVSFPIKNCGSFPSVVQTFTRGTRDAWNLHFPMSFPMVFPLTNDDFPIFLWVFSLVSHDFPWVFPWKTPQGPHSGPAWSVGAPQQPRQPRPDEERCWRWREQWDFHGDCIVISWDFHGDFMGFYGDFMGIQERFKHGL